MDTMIRCVGVAVIGAVLALVTRKYSGEFTVLVTIAVVAALGVAMLGIIKPVLQFLEELKERACVGDGMVSPVIRTLAIGYLTEIGKNICEEAGEKTVGNVLSGVGSVCAVYTLLPLMESVLALLEQML